MTKRTKRWFCKMFGHKFDDVELITLEIMQVDALNRDTFKGDFIHCKRCGVPCSFVPNMVGLWENPAEMSLK